jgi:membrane associated rhomboid family serine protease
VIPLSDNAGIRRRFPIINYLLIALNILAFIAQAQYGSCFTAAYAVVPYAITHGQALAVTGCPYGEPSPVYVTLLTSMFLHGSLLHIAGNMLYLWIFGDNVEDRLGHFWYFVFYLFCGLAASIAQIAVIPNSMLLNLGASGAIAGVLGAYLIFFPAARVRTFIFLGIFFTLASIPAVVLIGFWFVLQLLSGVASLSPAVAQSGGVAYFAHVGGFVAGLVIAVLVRAMSRPSRQYPQQSYPYWPRYPSLEHDYNEDKW